MDTYILADALIVNEGSAFKGGVVIENKRIKRLYLEEQWIYLPKLR